MQLTTIKKVLSLIRSKRSFRFRSVVLTVVMTVLLTGGFSLVEYCSNRMGIGPLELLTHAHAAEEKYTCGMHPMVIVDEPGSCPICGMDLVPLAAAGDSSSGGSEPKGERKIKYWAAPMDPTFIRDEPGKSPMGMDLVPVYEDEAPGGAIISIDPVTAQNMGVRTAVTVRKNLSRLIRTVGLVGYEEQKQYSINSKIDGWVEKLHVNETGQFVRKGDPLLEIYSPELVTAQEELLLALKHRDTLSKSKFSSISEGAERLLEASRKRLNLWDISDQQIRKIEKTGKAEKRLALYAPYDGIVNMKMVREGQYVKSGKELLMLSDISKVWVYADIYEYELPWVKTGLKADIILPFVGGKTISGNISYIYPFVEAKTRTVKARIELDNRDFELKPDMYVNIRIRSDVVDNVLTVPSEAVLHSGEKQTVFVALGDGKFEPRQVQTGVQDETGDIEIKQGLLDGETVVTSAQFMLDSESKLREAIAKMLEPKKDDAVKEHQHGDESMDDLFEDEEKGSKEELDDLFK